MNCPHCGAWMASAKKFCGDCGSPTRWLCNSCGSENPPGKRFCGDCGAVSSTFAGGPARNSAILSAETPAVERRQLTIMFTDLVGSTELSARLEPEDLSDVMGAWRRCVTGLVARWGGFLARYMGDGALALFGYPQAHEAEAERAVRAGLEIVEAVRRLNTPAGPPGTLDTRVGIATGLVIAGDLIGAGSALESTVIGETPNLAARLQTLADPGMVVIDSISRQLTGGLFEYRELGQTRLKGIPVPVWPSAVLRETEVESRFEALRAGHGPLLGRAQEVELLTQHWARAKAGHGHVVLLVGEAGIGKSRLIAAFEEALNGTPRASLRLLCSPHHQDTPLHPLIRYFEVAAGFRRGDGPPAKITKLRTLLGGVKPANAEALELLADLLSIPNRTAPSVELSPQRQKELTFAAVLDHIAAKARETALLAVVEDAHWIDPTTTELLLRLADLAERLPMLLIVTSRPDGWPGMSARPNVTTQVVNGINQQQAADLARQIAVDRPLPEEVITHIVARADGVPLFIEELTRTILGPPAPPGESAQPGPIKPLPSVPVSLQALLMARLDQLGSGKEVAQIGSIIGRDFSFEMLRAISDFGIDQLTQALDELARAGLITPHGVPPTATYLFHHALIQDAAYMSMVRERRRNGHRRLAEVLEQDTAQATAPDRLAEHFAEAGQAAKAIEYFLRAADRATGRLALAEAVRHLQKGLRWLADLPEKVAALRAELTLQVALGRALLDLRGSGHKDVFLAFERAHELSLKLGDTEKLLQAHDGLVNYHFTNSDLEQVNKYAGQVLEVGRQTGNRQALVMAYRSSGYARLLLGQFCEAKNNLERAAALYEAKTMLSTRDPKVSVNAALGICLTAMGRPHSAARVSREGVRHAESLSHGISLILGLRRACVQRMMVRDAAGVSELSARLLRLQAGYETFMGGREGSFFDTWAHLQTNMDASAMTLMRATLDQLDDERAWALLTFFLTAAAETMEAHGKLAEAAGALHRAAELVSATNERWCEAEIYRLQAKLAANDPKRAESLLANSLTIAREQGALLWELRSATDLAWLMRQREQPNAASRALASVYGRITEGFDLPDMAIANAMLAQLDHRSDSTPSM
jgi:class 3 adenylate cyclase/tetratricopeptide (TPR) repeat protein